MKAISLLLILFGIVTAAFMVLKPYLTIELQRRFYEKINWRVEPVSLQKEIRNTRFMGAFLLIVCVLTIVYALLRRA